MKTLVVEGGFKNRSQIRARSNSRKKEIIST